MMRGFAAIGLHRPKTPVNVGSVLRAAMCYGASSVAISGERINADQIRSACNTTQTQRHIPVLRGELRSLIPYGSIPVAVDLVDDAVSLPDFIHPHSAFYVFGPEDGTLGKDILDWCPKRVMIPTRFCMNLAATVNVILYDRMAKRGHSFRDTDGGPKGTDPKGQDGEAATAGAVRHRPETSA